MRVSILRLLNLLDKSLHSSAPPLRSLRLWGGPSSVLVHEDTNHEAHESHRRDAENAEEAQRSFGKLSSWPFRIDQVF